MLHYWRICAYVCIRCRRNISSEYSARRTWLIRQKEYIKFVRHFRPDLKKLVHELLTLKCSEFIYLGLQIEYLEMRWMWCSWHQYHPEIQFVAVGLAFMTDRQSVGILQQYAIRLQTKQFPVISEITGKRLILYKPSVLPAKEAFKSGDSFQRREGERRKGLLSTRNPLWTCQIQSSSN